jgi:ketosteroid isomerase-like protein
MKFLCFLALTILLNPVGAQDFSAELQSMVDAENAFAKYSKEKNTRDAFLMYLTDSTVLFDKNGPTKGKKSWTERSVNNSLLFWRPVFVGISKSGDLGFSTGPWEWSPTKESAKPEAYGYFASIWQKFPEGWKLALDLGTLLPGAESQTADLHSSNPTGVANLGTKRKEAFLKADDEYNHKIAGSERALFKEDFSEDALILRTGSFPSYYPFSDLSVAKSKFIFRRFGGDIASSNDLGYTFGRVKFESLQDGVTKPTEASFSRVWKIEDGIWKIVLEVIAVQN